MELLDNVRARRHLEVKRLSMNTRLQLLLVPVIAATFHSAIAMAQEGGPEGGPPDPSIRYVKNEQGVRGVLLRLYLEGTPDQAWSVVRSPTKAPSILDNVAAVLPRPDGLFEYRLSSPIGDKVMICNVTVNDKRREIHWRRLRGDLEAVEGYFKIGQDSRYPEHALVRYGSYIDPGGVGRGLMTNRRRRQSVLRMVARLRRLVRDG